MLTVTESEIILGMTIDNLLFFDKHNELIKSNKLSIVMPKIISIYIVYSVAQKGHNVNNMILSSIEGANIETYTSLFKCYVWPILEYGYVVYMPRYLYLFDAIEKVQRNYTKKLPSLCNMTYLQRLNVFNIESLQERRIKTDFI